VEWSRPALGKEPRLWRGDSSQEERSGTYGNEGKVWRGPGRRSEPVREGKDETTYKDEGTQGDAGQLEIRSWSGRQVDKRDGVFIPDQPTSW